MKRLGKGLVGAILALILVCCALIVVACTLTTVQVHMEPGEGMTFTGSYIEPDGDGGYYMPVSRGRTFSTSSITEGKDYILEDGYFLTGWTLLEDGELHEIDEAGGETALSFSFSIKYGVEYLLTASTEYREASFSLEYADDTHEGITINTSTFSVPAGVSFDPLGNSTDAYAVPEGAYTLEPGYVVTGWTVNGEALDGSFTAQAGSTYVLVPTVSLADITVTVADPEDSTKVLDTITQKYGTTISLDDISYNPPEGYALAGWSLAIDGEDASDQITDNIITLDQIADYVLTPVIEQSYITISITVSPSSSSRILILDGQDTVSVAIGETFCTSSLAEGTAYTISTGYTISWSLLVNDTEDETFDGSFEVAKDTSYELMASAVPVQVSISVQVENTETSTTTTIDTVNKDYGETFSIQDDISYTPETGYEVQGYTVQEGSGTARSMDSWETEFQIESTEGYTVTIQVGYIELSYVIYQDDGFTEITSGKTHYGDIIDLSGIDTSWVTEGYSIGYWEVAYGENGTDTATGDSYTIQTVEDYTFTAKLIHDELHVIIYKEAYVDDSITYNVYTSIDEVYVGSVIQLSEITYTLDDTDYEVTGWTLRLKYNDSDSVTTTPYGTSDIFTIEHEGSFNLYPVLTKIQVPISITRSEDDSSRITITTTSDTCASGESYDVSDIEYTITDTNYELTGWSLTILDSESQETTRNLGKTDTFEVKAGNTYILEAVVEQVSATITLSVALDGSSEHLTINTASVTKDIGYDFDVDTDIISGMYSLDYGYEITWSLIKNNASVDSFDGTFEVETDTTYDLVASVSLAKVTVTVAISGVETSEESVTMTYGDMFYLTGENKSLTFDVSNYTGYEITGYSVQYGSTTDNLDAGATSFEIESTDDYTLTIMVGLKTLNYIIYKEDDTTTLASGTTTYNGSITIPTYSPEETASAVYELTGWTVYIYDNGEYVYSSTLGSDVTSLIVETVADYKIVATTDQTAAKITIQAADGSEGHITLAESPVVSKTVGATFDVTADITDEICKANTGYTITWSLLKDGSADATFNGTTFTVEKGIAYTLTAAASAVEVTVTVEVEGIYGVTITGVDTEYLSWNVTKNYDETFSLETDTEFDISNYAGYKFDHYAVDGTETSSDFEIKSVDGYTVSIYVDYITYTYTFCQEGGKTTISSGTMHIGEVLTLPSYTPADTDYSLLGWYVYIGGSSTAESGIITGETYTVEQAADYKFVAELQHDTLHVTAYDPDGNLIDSIDVSIGDTVDMSTVATSYSPKDDDYGSYNVSGWNLYMDDNEESIETIAADGELSITEEGSYRLVAVLEQITAKITLTAVCADVEGDISLTYDTVSADLTGGEGTYSITSSIYTLTYPDDCDLTWSIKAGDGDAVAVTGDSFNVAAESTYELIATVTRKDVEITLSVNSDDTDIIEITEFSITVKSGVEYDVSDIGYEMLSENYEFTGWTLYINDVAQEGIIPTDGTVTAHYGYSYTLEAVVDTIKVSITFSEGDYGDYVTIVTGTVEVEAGATYTITDGMDNYGHTIYTITNSNYELVKWALRIENLSTGNGTNSEPNANYSFVAKAGRSYTFKAIVQIIEVNISFSAGEYESCITINNDSYTADSGTAYYITNDSDSLYTITDSNYELTGWMLTITPDDGESETKSIDAEGSFDVSAGNTYSLVPVMKQVSATITLEADGDSTGLITFTTTEIVKDIGAAFSIDSEISSVMYTLADSTNYYISGWTLLENGSAAGMPGNSFTVAAGITYVLQASVERIPVEITIEADSNDSSRIEIIASSVSVGSGLEYTISAEMYSMTDTNYEVTGWTLYVNDTAQESTYSDGDSFTVTTGNAYKLVPVVQGKEVVISISDGTITLGTYTARYGDTPTVASVVTDATEYTPAEWYYQDGWTVTISGSSTVVKADEVETATIEINDLSATYVLTPYVVEYGYITVTLTGMSSNDDKMSLGTVDDEYDGTTKIIVGDSYVLPDEESSYIMLLESAYGLKGWILYDSSNAVIETYTLTLVGGENLISLPAGGAYTLVPVVEQYLTVNLASDVTSDFVLEEIRVYTGDDFTLPASDSAYITANNTGRSIVGWYLETEDGEVVSVDGGTNGIYECSAEIGEIEGSLKIWPVLSDTSYPLDVNGRWHINRESEESVSVSDHGGTVLGTDSYTDVWHYLSETQMYDKDTNSSVYTVYNVGVLDESEHNLVSGYWFRLNTAAGNVTLTDGNSYDFYYCFTNFSTSSITFDLYVCSNGFMDQSDTQSKGYTRSYLSTTVTVPANSSVEIVLYGFVEDQTPTDENNFITVIQLREQCTDMKLGFRINVEESDATATGTVYIQNATGISYTGDWSTDISWTSAEFTVGTTIQLTDEGVSVVENYVLLGWYLLDNNGNRISDLLDKDYSFTLSSDTVYLEPYVLYYEDAYGHVTLASGLSSISLNTSTYANNEDDYFSYVDNADAVLPTAEQVDDTTGKTLTGWYVETDAGTAVGSYSLGGSVSGMKTNIVIYPVYEETYYILNVNDSDKSGMTTDHAGTEIGTDLGTDYTSLIAETDLYNLNDNVMEYAITKASGQTLPAGYWFRTNTFVTSGSGRSSTSTETYLDGGLVANAYYDVYYALTNHGSVDITITVYQCTNGYMGTTTGSATTYYESQVVTIKAGETVYVNFLDFCEKDTSANNFITVYQLSDECSDFQLGMRIRIEEAKATINISTDDVAGFSLDESSDWNSMRVTKGVSVTVPEYDVDFTISAGYVFLGWYIVDENDNEIEFVADGGTVTATDSSLTIKPYVVSEADATRSVTISASVIASISLTSAVTYQLSTTSVTVTLPVDTGDEDNVTNETGLTLEGWYVTDSTGAIYGTSTTGIYAAGAAITVDAFSGDKEVGGLIIWPVFEDTSYNLDVNGAMTTSKGDVTDESGPSVGTNNSNQYGSNFLASKAYNSKDYVEEYLVYGDGTTFASGVWFRLNTYATGAGITLTSGNYYNISYAITNHSSTDITISVYHCTNGYLQNYPSVSDTNNYMENTNISITAGSTVYFTFSEFYENTAPTTNNFITIIELNTAVSDLSLGFRINLEEIRLTAPTAFSYDSETGIVSITDSNDASMVECFEVGLFASEDDTTASYTYSLSSEDVMQLGYVESGTYTVKVKAISCDEIYADSDWYVAEDTIAVTNSLTTITNGLQSAAYSAAGTWYEYHPTSGATTTVSRKIVNNGDGSIYVSFTNTGSTEQPLKIFYNDNSYSEGDLYTLSFTFVSCMEGYITVNDEVVQVHTGSNEISVTRELPAYGSNSYNVITIQFGATVGSTTRMLVGEFEIHNLTYSKVTQLATPSFTYDSDTVAFTISDDDSDNVAEYVVGLFSDSTLKYTLELDEDNKIDTSNVVEGSYTAKVMALTGSTSYADSEWSSSTATITVSDTGLTEITYSLQGNANGQSTWHEYSTSSSATINLLYVDSNSSIDGDIGTVYVDYTAQSQSNEPLKLFYDDDSVTEGQTYTLTFTLYSEIDGYITVNEQTVEIHTGYNYIEVTRELPGSGAVCIVTIAFGATVDGSNVFVDGYFVLSDFSWEIVEDTD